MKPLVKVTWWDAKDADETWLKERDAAEFNDKEIAIVSVGFLMSKTDKYVTLAGDWCEEDKTCGCVRKIPIGMVVSFSEVKE